MLCCILIVVSAFLYIFREQSIDIGLIPNEFAYCGEAIWGNDAEYQKIVSWLKDNKEGWVISLVTFVPKQVYSSPAFNVNVMENSVVVSYKTDYGYPQYVKTIQHDLNNKCANQLTRPFIGHSR